MKRRWIDFMHPVSPRQQAIRFGLLLLGTLALAYVLFRQHQISDEKTALVWQQQNLAQLESRKLPMLRASMTGEIAQDATKRANEVLRQLNQPWDRLFDALEHAVVPGISVLSVAPDPHKSTVTLRASAPDMNAALDFINRLQASRTLNSVHLVTQETMVGDKRQSLLFTISAEWKAAS